MNKELEFAKTLEKVRQLAKEQGNVLSRQQVEEEFAKLEITGEQLLPVYEYLKGKNIGIGEPLDWEEALTREEKDYLSEYVDSLKEMDSLTEGEKRAYAMSAMAGDGEGKLKILQYFLPQVVDLAKLYIGQGVLLEDLIGEGNVALATGVEMLGCLEQPDEVEGMLANMIMNAMEECIHENTEAKKIDFGMVERVNRISDLAKELAESLQRKITVEELCEEASITKEEIEEAIRLSGNKIEYFA